VLRRFALRPADSKVTQSNLAQAIVTILVAAALAAGTLLSAAGTSAWQQSVRDEIKRFAALAEDVRTVYGDEAPIAFELALAKARGAVSPPSEAVVERKARFQMQQALSGGGREHLTSARYERGDGYDVLRRLADVRREHPDLVGLDPDIELERGDRLTRWALLVLAATIPLVIGFLLVDFVQRRRGNRAPAARQRGARDVSLVPRPWSSGESRQFRAFVFLGAWMLVTLLPTLQLHYANSEQRAQALAARKAAELSSLLQVTGITFSFATASAHRVTWLATHAVGHEFAGAIASVERVGARDAAERRADAHVEEALSRRAKRLVANMVRLPTSADPIDSTTSRALATTEAILRAKGSQQVAEAERAERSGARGNRTTLAVLLAGLALSLTALAGVARARRPSLLDVSAAVVLLMAVAALVSLPL